MQRSVWDEHAKTWTVHYVEGGVERTITGHAVISAVGQLNRPLWPTIDGIADFGEVVLRGIEGLGDITHGAGGYLHDLRALLFNDGYYTDDWRRLWRRYLLRDSQFVVLAAREVWRDRSRRHVPRSAR